MCWMCEKEAQVGRYFDNDVGACMHIARVDMTMAAVGGITIPTQNAGLLVIGDAVPANSSTSATLSVDGGAVVGALETIGDQDWFKVTLEGGHSYEIGMYAKYGGPNCAICWSKNIRIRIRASTNW